MCPLIVQSLCQTDSAKDSGEFFWGVTFIKFKSIFIWKCKTESGGTQDKYTFANKEIRVTIYVQKTDILAGHSGSRL